MKEKKIRKRGVNETKDQVLSVNGLRKGKKKKSPGLANEMEFPRSKRGRQVPKQTAPHCVGGRRGPAGNKGTTRRPVQRKSEMHKIRRNEKPNPAMQTQEKPQEKEVGWVGKKKKSKLTRPGCLTENPRKERTRPW